MWGVVTSDEGELHVMPCDEDGGLLPEHVLSTHCYCGPRQDVEVECLWIHQDPERGGADA